jgi:hypothetical protein
MTPTAPELLAGCAAALAKSPRPEDGGVFGAARLTTVATINVLVAQECAPGGAVRVAENAALRALLADAASSYGRAFDEARTIGDGDLSLAALDQANAALRRLLIGLHQAVEAAGDRQMDRTILALYRDMARGREMTLPASRPVVAPQS